jgi:UDP-glucose 6-dehydrogenase
MENSFIATKVVFMNEFARIAKTYYANVNVVREGFLDDPRMSRDFSFVYEDKPGFDGKCLPKDLNAIVHAAAKAGYDPKFIRAVIENNDRLRSN